MTKLGSTSAEAHGLDRLRRTGRLVNHWGRPIGPRSYYWYLTFEQSSVLHRAVRYCQEAIAFPYFDLVPDRTLHLTLDRVAFESGVDADQLSNIKAAATVRCREVEPFPVSIGPVSGTPGAIGFDVNPEAPIRRLRNHLRSATLSVNPAAPVRRSRFHAHIAVAYSNSDGTSTAEVVAAIESLGRLGATEIGIKDVSLVLLERHARSYEWTTICQIPLTG